MFIEQAAAGAFCDSLSIPISAVFHFRKTLSALLAGLVSDSAAGLARGLAGCLALTASALLHAFLKRSGVQSLNMLH